MRRIVILAVISAAACSSAIAEVSADLRFCSGLASSKERLACFEAIARGTSSLDQSKYTESPSTALPQVAPPRLERTTVIRAPRSPNSTFSGVYSAIGGGFGAINGRSATVYGPVGAISGISLPSHQATGGNLNGVFGLNLPVGESGIVGLEFSARFRGETSDQSGTSTVTDYFRSRSYPVSGTYRLENEAGLHVSARAGVTFDDWLIFIKGGFGAVQIKETFTADQSLVLPLCTNYSSYPSPTCHQFTPQGSLSGYSTTSWLPSALIGLGIERNVGPLFVRIGADAEIFRMSPTSVSAAASGGVVGYSSATDDIHWAVRGTGMLGYRF